MTTNDLLRHGDHFPLGAREEGVESANRVNDASPFGLRYLTQPPTSAIAEIDHTKIIYDPDRQIAIVINDDESVLPALRHTSVQTKTSTASHDRGAPDTDTVFGAFDFAVTSDGEWVFLEVNPNGQWAFVEQVTGLPIAAAIADALTGQTGPA